jgi:hypothetical protein
LTIHFSFIQSSIDVVFFNIIFIILKYYYYYYYYYYLTTLIWMFLIYFRSFAINEAW